LAKVRGYWTAGTVILAWTVTQVVFTLHYAHEYWWPAGLCRRARFPGRSKPGLLGFLLFRDLVWGSITDLQCVDPDALATLLDTALVIPGTGVRFGLDALIGLFPVVGDIITTALSLFIVHEAYQLGAPGHVIARMLGNVALDGVFGAVPLVGDAFDVLWRANRRNVRLLREWLDHERRR
jgi:Domain of unknown function (DUF4112)/Protein of unknown function (DUF1345)